MQVPRPTRKKKVVKKKISEKRSFLRPRESTALNRYRKNKTKYRSISMEQKNKTVSLRGAQNTHNHNQRTPLELDLLQHAVCNLPSPMSAPRGRPTLWPGGAGQCGRAGHGLCYQVPASSLSSSRCFFQTSGEPSGCSRHIPRRGLFASKRSIWR